MSDHPATLSPEDFAGIARFLHLAGGIKRVPRSGWLDRGVPAAACESVADHSWRVTLLAWAAATASGVALDLSRVIRLAILHDIAEAIAGDETPYERDAVAVLDPAARADYLDRRHIPDAERSRRKAEAEGRAFVEMTASLPEAFREELAALWAELAARETPEARFVKDADRLETYLQSREYAAAFPGLPVASFAAEVADMVRDPAAAALRDAIAGLAISPDEASPGPDGSGPGRAPTKG